MCCPLYPVLAMRGALSQPCNPCCSECLSRECLQKSCSFHPTHTCSEHFLQWVSGEGHLTLSKPSVLCGHILMPTLSFISLKLKINSLLTVYTEDLWYPKLSLIDIYTGSTAVASTDIYTKNSVYVYELFQYFLSTLRCSYIMAGRMLISSSL